MMVVTFNRDLTPYWQHKEAQSINFQIRSYFRLWPSYLLAMSILGKQINF